MIDQGERIVFVRVLRNNLTRSRRMKGEEQCVGLFWIASRGCTRCGVVYDEMRKYARGCGGRCERSVECVVLYVVCCLLRVWLCKLFVVWSCGRVCLGVCCTVGGMVVCLEGSIIRVSRVGLKERVCVVS